MADKAKAWWRCGGLLDGHMVAYWAMARWWCGSWRAGRGAWWRTISNLDVDSMETHHGATRAKKITTKVDARLGSEKARPR